MIESRWIVVQTLAVMLALACAIAGCGRDESGGGTGEGRPRKEADLSTLLAGPDALAEHADVAAIELVEAARGWLVHPPVSSDALRVHIDSEQRNGKTIGSLRLEWACRLVAEEPWMGLEVDYTPENETDESGVRYTASYWLGEKTGNEIRPVTFERVSELCQSSESISMLRNTVRVGEEWIDNGELMSHLGIGHDVGSVSLEQDGEHATLTVISRKYSFDFAKNGKVASVRLAD